MPDQSGSYIYMMPSRGSAHILESSEGRVLSCHATKTPVFLMLHATLLAVLQSPLAKAEVLHCKSDYESIIGHGGS